MFSDNAKIECASLLDKHADGKYSVNNVRPVNLINTFSKIYQKIGKDFLISKMEHHFSPFISAYRKSFSTEHVLIRLLEDWRNKLDNNNVVGANSTDLSKAFDCILKPLIVDSMTYWWLNLMHMVSIELL